MIAVAVVSVWACLALLAIAWVRGATGIETPSPLPSIYEPDQDHVLVTSQGVEIPIGWLAGDRDLDEVVATLYDIESLGAPA